MHPLDPHPLDEEAPPSIVINPHSELGKELRKWEQHYTHMVPPGTHPGNPYVFRAFPKMLYKAQRSRAGQLVCFLPTPSPFGYDKADQYQMALHEKETFDKACQRIVKDEGEELLARGQGWCETIPAALEQAEREQRAIADAAAEAAHAALRMTDKAKRELADADASTHEHVTDVKPAKKRGRPAKGIVAVSEA